MADQDLGPLVAGSGPLTTAVASDRLAVNVAQSADSAAAQWDEARRADSAEAHEDSQEAPEAASAEVASAAEAVDSTVGEVVPTVEADRTEADTGKLHS
jgi:hypothetical protein